MDKDRSGPEVGQVCAACGRPAPAGEGREHLGRWLCEDCYVQARIDRTRKTHWQYLGAIKTEYLQEPGGED